MLDINEIKEKVSLAVPEGTVVTAHTEEGHFYKIKDDYVKDVLKRESVTYPSVTKKLQVLKDPSIANFKMNRAIDYVFGHFSETVKQDAFVTKKIEEGDFKSAEDYIREAIFDKPEEYYNLEKLRKAVQVDRRLTLREILEKIFDLTDELYAEYNRRYNS